MKHRFLFQHDTRLLTTWSGCCPQTWRWAYAQGAHVVQTLTHLAQEGCLDVVQAPFQDIQRHDALCHKLSRSFQDVKIIVVIGTPDSMVTVRALVALMQSWVWVQGARARVCILDQLDAEVFWQVMSVADPAHTGIFVFSEGHSQGHAMETLLMMRCLEYWYGVVPREQLQQRVVVVSPQDDRLTANRPTPVNVLAQQFGVHHLTYTPVHKLFMQGSRTTDARMAALNCFAYPFALPAWLLGFNTALFYQGAAATCVQFFAGTMRAPIEYAAWRYALERRNTLARQDYWIQRDGPLGINKHLVTGHTFATQNLGHWMHQVSQVFTSLHAMPQAPTADLYTHILEERGVRERLQPHLWEHTPAVADLAQQSLRDYAQHQQEAIAQQQARTGMLLRFLRVSTLNEETLGALMMNHILQELVWHHGPWSSKNPVHGQ